MSKVIELLDAVKKAKGIETDYALAKTLELPRGYICDFYKGKRHPNEFACLQIAKALNRDYNEISAAIRIEAEKNEKRRSAWQDYYKSIGGWAASFMLMMFAAVTLIITVPSNAIAKTATYADTITRNTNYALIRRLVKYLVLAVKHKISNVIPRRGFLY